MTIKLGIIGASPGNGHPYSWSAIFNGYDNKKMKECGYPAIPEYLSKENWPEARLRSAKITSIWTQDRITSEHIANSSYINHISSSLEELEERVDGVLLARDDAENHIKFARPFLSSGKPIYIDKPIALSVHELNRLYDLQQYEGQIFTCSALRYSDDLSLTSEQKTEIGELISIIATIPNSWKKYSVHIIEPVLNMIAPSDAPELIRRLAISEDIIKLKIKWKSGIYTSFSTKGDVDEPVRIRVHGHLAERELVFKNTFLAFKSALQDFVSGIINNECKSPIEFNQKVVNLIERGIR